jgi:ATP-binding cassette subfamily B multidrug efflux pump
MDNNTVRPLNWKTVRKLGTYAALYKFRLAAAILILMLAVGTDLLGPLITMTIIDEHLSKVGEPDFAFMPILKLVGLYVCLLLSAGIFNYTQSYLLQTTALRIVLNMRMEIMQKLQRIPVRFFDNTPIGQLVNRIANDTESIRDLYMSFMATFSVSLVQVSGIFILLFVVDANLAVYALFLLPLYLFIMRMLLKYGNRYLTAMRARISDMNTMLSESILVMPILQLFRREKETIREFEELNDDWMKNHYKQLRLNSMISRNLIGLSGSLLTALLIWNYGSQSLQAAISIGAMAAFLDYTGRLFFPVIAVFDQLVNAQRAFVAADRVFELLDEPTMEVDQDAAKRDTAMREAEQAVAEQEVANRSTLTEVASEVAVSAGTLGRKKGDVKFDEVWFAYKEGEYVLKGLSFEALQGQTIAFVGHTGSGKSSVMNLLLGFYETKQGKITVDGRDINAITKQELRRDMAVVLQDPFLFAGDIKFNVSMYSKEIDREQVRKALVDVGADTFVDRLPHGIDEPVVERGSTLSAGQRQLITFARALAHNPAILILDEATASIDSETEGLIQHALEVLKSGRTTFIIAHRLSTIRDADQILVLHKGEIVERGNHEELMQKQGRYYKMYELQKGGAPVA